VRNFLPDMNRFHLAEPPQWWLTMLHDVDSDLVVFPSRTKMVFVLARRRNKSNAMEALDKLDKQLLKKTAGGDGDVMADNNLIYVRQLVGNTVRRPELFQWLRDHDTWHEGAEKFDKKIVSAEEHSADVKRRKMIDDIDHRARDAWRSYQARTGRRAGYTSNSSGRAKQMPMKRFTPAESPLAIFSR